MKSVLLIPLKVSATPHSDRASLNFYGVSKAVNYSPVWSAQANKSRPHFHQMVRFQKKMPVKKRTKKEEGLE